MNLSSQVPRPGSWLTRATWPSSLATLGLAAFVASTVLASSAQAATHASPSKPLAVTRVVPRVQAPKTATLAPQISFNGTVSLKATPTTLAGGYTTLTATTTADVGPTPYYIEIFDATAGDLLAVCGVGTSCSASTTLIFAGLTHSYVAYVSAYSTAFPPPDIQSISAVSYVTWAETGWQVSLSANPTYTNGSTTLTATANHDVGPTPYYIEIFNENGTLIHECPSGSTCSVSYSPPPNKIFQHLIAFVSSYGTSLPPGNIQASSNEVDVLGQNIQ
jgi:hypothetical protein